MVGHEVHRLPDLTLAGFAVTHDDVNLPIDAALSGGQRQPRADAETLPERTGRRVEEREALGRVGMTVERAVGLAQCSEIGRAQRPRRRPILAHDAAEIGIGRIDGGHGMALRKHEPVIARVPGIGRIVAHHVVHERDDEMDDRQRAAGMTGACRGRHAHHFLAEFDALVMNERVEAHPVSPLGDSLCLD